MKAEIKVVRPGSGVPFAHLPLEQPPDLIHMEENEPHSHSSSICVLNIQTMLPQMKESADACALET